MPKFLPLHLLVVLPHVVRPDGPEEPDVVVRVKLGHLLLGRLVRTVDLHLSVQPVVQQQVVRHPYPVGLHGVALAIVVVPDITVVVVTHFRLVVGLHLLLFYFCNKYFWY